MIGNNGPLHHLDRSILELLNVHFVRFLGRTEGTRMMVKIVCFKIVDINSV